MTDSQMTGGPTRSWVMVADADGRPHLESRWTMPETAPVAAPAPTAQPAHPAPAAHAA